MAHKKAAWSAKNLRDSNPKYRGVKIFGGQHATAWAILIRQKGDKYKAGKNVYVGKDFTLHASVEGVVSFRKKKVKRYDGRKYTKTFIDVLPLEEQSKKAPAKKTASKKTVKAPAKKSAPTKETAKEPAAKTWAETTSMTVKDLKAKAKDLGIAGYSTMKKAELVTAIDKA